MSKIAEIARLIETGKSKEIAAMVQAALDEGDNPDAILNDGMIAVMGIVGDKFQKNELFVPEMLASARTMKKGVEALKPYLASESLAKRGKCIIGTVLGDHHDIGKNLVALMIESAGFEIIDLRIDVPVEAFIHMIKENPDVKIVALSALLTTTMRTMKEMVAALRSFRYDDKSLNFKIIVGGAPITQEFANEIGADGYARDAAGAAQLATQLAT
jgi:methanogenic corrinoid protein MtbC1